MTRPEFDDIPLSAEDATAVLRWGAAEEKAPAGAAESAVNEIRSLAAEPDGRIAFADVLAAIDKYVPEPGKFILGRHQKPGQDAIIGSYWALEDAISCARKPGARCAWTDGAYFHDLRITAADGVTVWFHAFCPERYAGSNPDRRARILADIARYSGAGNGRPAAATDKPAGYPRPKPAPGKQPCPECRRPASRIVSAAPRAVTANGCCPARDTIAGPPDDHLGSAEAAHSSGQVPRSPGTCLARAHPYWPHPEPAGEEH